MAKKKSSREDLWRRRLAQWKRSGLSQAEFCRRKEISVATFRWWKQKLDAAEPKPKRRSKGAAFVPVKIVPTRPSPAAVELLLAGGRMLRIRPGFDPALLRQLLSALESPAC